MKIKALVVLVSILTVITAANAVLGVYNFSHLKHQVSVEHRSFRQVSTQNCEEIELVKGALRATLEQANKFTNTSKVRTRAEKKAGDKIYHAILRRFQARKCQVTPKGKHDRRIPKEATKQH